jgi:hypothetical protein
VNFSWERTLLARWFGILPKRTLAQLNELLELPENDRFGLRFVMPRVCVNIWPCPLFAFVSLDVDLAPGAAKIRRKN